MDWDMLKNIAVVGLSDNPEKASYIVGKYLQQGGFIIIPVNPAVDKVLGEQAYPEIKDIPPYITIDAVDIFRRAEAVLPIVEQVVARGGVKIVWMQEGVVNEEAAALARNAGIEVVMDKCMRKEHIKSVSSGI